MSEECKEILVLEKDSTQKKPVWRGWYAIHLSVILLTMHAMTSPPENAFAHEVFSVLRTFGLAPLFVFVLSKRTTDWERFILGITSRISMYLIVLWIVSAWADSIVYSVLHYSEFYAVILGAALAGFVWFATSSGGTKGVKDNESLSDNK